MSQPERRNANLPDAEIQRIIAEYQAKNPPVPLEPSLASDQEEDVPLSQGVRTGLPGRRLRPPAIQMTGETVYPDQTELTRPAPRNGQPHPVPSVPPVVTTETPLVTRPVPTPVTTARSPQDMTELSQTLARLLTDLDDLGYIVKGFTMTETDSRLLTVTLLL